MSLKISENIEKARKLIYKEPEGLIQRIQYAVSIPLAYFSLYCCPESLIQFTIQHKVVHLIEAFYKDLGGEQVAIQTDHGHVLQGFYLSARKFTKNEKKVFREWKPKFLADQAVADYLMLKSEGKTLAEFFDYPSLPRSQKMKGAVICNGANNLYQADPNLSLMYLARRISVITFNYGGVYKSVGKELNGNTINLDGVAAGRYLKETLKCVNKELIFHGKSLGSSIATFLGTQFPGAKVVLDRYFSSMADIAKTQLPFAERFMGIIQQFYPFPTKNLLEYVEGDVLLIRAKDDEMMGEEHTMILEEVLIAVKKPQDRESFMKTHSITAPGRHQGILWYNDSKTQKALSTFIDTHG